MKLASFKGEKREIKSTASRVWGGSWGNVFRAWTCCCVWAFLIDGAAPVPGLLLQNSSNYSVYTVDR